MQTNVITIGSTTSVVRPVDDDIVLPPQYASADLSDTKANILARTSDTTGTVAFATDTKELMIFNTTGYDSWTVLAP